MSDKYFINHSDRVAVFATPINLEFPKGFFDKLCRNCHDYAINTIFILNTEETDFKQIEKKFGKKLEPLKKYATVIYQKPKNEVFNLEIVHNDFGNLPSQNMVYFGLTGQDKESAQSPGHGPVRYIDMRADDFDPKNVKFPPMDIILEKDKLIILDIWGTIPIESSKRPFAVSDEFTNFLKKCKKKGKQLAISTDSYLPHPQMKQIFADTGLNKFFNEKENGGKGNKYGLEHILGEVSTKTRRGIYESASLYEWENPKKKIEYKNIGKIIKDFGVERDEVLFIGDTDRWSAMKYCVRFLECDEHSPSFYSKIKFI